MSPHAASLAITRTGLRIGCAWTPPPAGTDRDHQRLQAALLEPRTATPLSLAARVAGAIWRWL